MKLKFNDNNLIFRYYSTKCSGCMQSIPPSELVMRALGSVYHVTCFVCVSCGHTLQKGDQFVLREGHLHCRMCFEKDFAYMNMVNDWGPYSPKSRLFKMVSL